VPGLFLVGVVFVDKKTGEKTLIILDPVLKKGFVATPNLILAAPGLSLPAKALYSILLMFAWQKEECFPGQEKLAEVAGCTDRTIRKYLDELREYGLISWTQRGLNQTNIYYINDISKVGRLQALCCKDRKELSGPDRKGCSVQNRKELSDKKDSDQYNVVVESPDCHKLPEKKTLTARRCLSADTKRTGDDSQEPPVVSMEADSEEDDKVDSPAVQITEADVVRDLQSVVKAVCASEIPEDVLRKLALCYGIVKVKEKLRLLQYVSEVNNVVGWLISALKNDYRRVPGSNQSRRQTRNNWPGKKSRPAERRITEDRYSEKEREIIKSLYLS